MAGAVLLFVSGLRESVSSISDVFTRWRTTPKPPPSRPQAGTADSMHCTGATAAQYSMGRDRLANSVPRPPFGPGSGSLRPMLTSYPSSALSLAICNFLESQVK